MSTLVDRFDFGVRWEAGYGYSQAIRVGDILYISGQLPHDADGNLLGAGDFELQTKAVFANLDEVLSHYCANRGQIVQTTVLVQDLPTHFDPICRLHAEYFGDNRPTSAIYGVVDLAFPNQLVEVCAVAHLDI